MNRKKPIKFMAALMSVVVATGLFSFLSFNDVFAAAPTYLTQDMITNNGGSIPPLSSGTYTLADDVTVTAGTTVDFLSMNLNGHIITYDNPNKNVYMLSLTNGTGGIDIESGSIISTGAPIVSVTSDGNLSFRSVNIEGSATSYDSNGKSPIYISNPTANGGGLSLSYSSITGFSSVKGGAICADSYYSDVYLGNSTIDRCYADEGGAIYSVGTVSLFKSTLTENSAETAGGAVYICEYGRLLVETAVTIKNNSCTALNAGGGICINRKSDGGEYKDENYGLQISPSLSIQDVIDITENTSGGKRNNVFFGDGKRNAMIISEDPYTMRMGISVEDDRDNPIIDRIPSSYEIGGLFSDDEGKFIEFKNGSYYISKINKNVVSIKGYGAFVYEGDLFLECIVYLSPDMTPSDITASYSLDSFEGISAKTGIALNTYIEELRYYSFSIPVDSAYMASDIDVALSSGGKTFYSDNISVKDYAKAIIDHDYKYSDKEVDFTKALLNFGAASQKYFKVNTDDLANSFLFESDKISHVPQDVLDAYQPFTINSDINSSVSYYGMSLTLKSELVLKVYFKINGNYTANDFIAGLKFHELSYEIHETNSPKYFYIEFTPYNGYYGLEAGVGIYMAKRTQITSVDYSTEFQLEMSVSYMDYILSSLTTYKGEDPELDELMAALYVLNSEY